MNDVPTVKTEENFAGVKLYFNEGGEVNFEIKNLTPAQLLKMAMRLDTVKNIFMASVVKRMEDDER